MPLALYRASGHSMEPEIKNGSFFIASSLLYLFIKPKVGDRIVFKNQNKVIVKKISKIENGNYWILGINLSDSKNFNPLKRNEILGKVLWIF